MIITFVKKNKKRDQWIDFFLFKVIFLVSFYHFLDLFSLLTGYEKKRFKKCKSSMFFAEAKLSKS